MTPRARSVSSFVCCSLLAAGFLAGCVTPPEEAGQPEDVAEPGVRFEGNFTVPEDAEGVWLNLSVERNAPEAGDVRVDVLDPEGDTAVTFQDEWPAGRHPIGVDLAFGNVSGASVDVDLEPGTWSYRVITDGSVRVHGTVTVVNGDGALEVA